MRHEWEQVKGKPGLICKWCTARFYGGNATNVCHRRVEAGLVGQLKEEVEREKKGDAT